MPLSKEKKQSIAVLGLVIILAAAAVFIIIQYPEVLVTPEKPALQILSRDMVAGRNESGNSEVNASFVITIKNTGTSNESKILVCKVTFRTESNELLTFDNRTLVSLTPGETRIYHPVIILPDSAKTVSWSLSTVFEWQLKKTTVDNERVWDLPNFTHEIDRIAIFHLRLDSIASHLT